VCDNGSLLGANPWRRDDRIWTVEATRSEESAVNARRGKAADEAVRLGSGENP
jgi:hypothetical protein